MRKVILLALAFCLVSGVANAANIPKATDPKNQSEVWTVEVYNNEGSTLTSGTVVCWDFDSVSSPTAYTDRCMYVNTTTTADDVWTAGVVVDASIPATSEGTIAIWGPVFVRTAESSGSAISAGDLVGNCDNLEGNCEDFTGGGADLAVLGVAIKASATAVTSGGLNGAADGSDNAGILIFVDPVRYSDD